MMSLTKGEIIMTVKDVITARYIIEECLDVRFMLDTMRFGPKIDVQDMMILWEPISKSFKIESFTLDDQFLRSSTNIILIYDRQLVLRSRKMARFLEIIKGSYRGRKGKTIQILGLY